VKASARVVAEADGRGGTRLAVLRGESPLLLRRTGRGAGPGVTVHLVGGAAGPLRGDDLRLDLEVGPGAELEVRSVAASLALPGRPGAPPSRLEVRAAVASGAVLRWLPEPLIAAAGCDHRAVTHVEVADGGRLLWRDDLVCGRHGEPSGDVGMRTTIRYAGATLYRHDLAVGPGAPGWSGAAVLGGAPAGPAGGGRATGSVVFAGTDLPPTGPAGEHAAATPRGGPAGEHFAVMPLAGPGALAVAVGADIRAVRAALDPLCAVTAATAAWSPAAAGTPA
jgi:urease accessory protein